MSTEFKVVGNAARSSISVGDLVPASVNKRGELYMVPWHVQLALEGRVMSAGAGAEDTPFTLGNTAVDLDQPEFVLRIPAGTSIVPLWVHAALQASGAVRAQGLITVSDNDPGSGTSTAADRLAKGISTSSNGSACTAIQLVTANLTLTNQRTVLSFTEAGDMDAAPTGNNQFTFSYLDTPLPVLHGPAALMVYLVNGTSGTGWIDVIWAEFTTTELR